MERNLEPSQVAYNLFFHRDRYFDTRLEACFSIEGILAMQTTTLAQIDAAYDKVGAYNQDAVNGFSEQMIYTMLDLVQPTAQTKILDAMAGNGNLTLRLHTYCQQRGIALPEVTMLELSRVQCDFAQVQLAGTPTQVICGDVLTMQDVESAAVLPDATFDRVMIKSGSHEIPLEQQLTLYRSILRVLKPGGLFVNLGFVFDDVEERDQFREITRLKDRLAGLQSAADNRHILTRSELYGRLEQAGFADVRCGRQMPYTIRTIVGVQTYFPQHEWDYAHGELQAQQAKSFALRRKGRIQFYGDTSVMICPGEITVARRPLV